ncbi:P-loop containing nucleoside triphosphate hydrolase protein [Massariosphaeria phaeospora]|uniref:P-loop containing nucleoside triphosphate hydrolase protein n=1 Tax=Massariosphaeria phaeospora TaxID=100035 RepID=A0A7C8MH83_9PLEO|nr:P-loop containing nucleoside triphosphate hydrolase protein [Massariosphaeria phaeospora]
MTDLLQVLPDLDTRPYTHLLPSLDRALISTNDLLTLDAVDVAKRAQLPAGDLRKLVEAVTAGLHRHLAFGGEEAGRNSFLAAPGNPQASALEWSRISTLDEQLDTALGGGIPSGYLVEVTGESGAGKTQLLLTLLLAAQLPPPRGLSKSAIYISTEAALATTRLAQLLSTHPSLAALPSNEKPSLSKILSIQTPDLESQEHILRYQLPVAIRKHGVGLVILDSVAANYRAEFEKKGERNSAAAMAKRGGQLVQLGALLRDLARTEGIAIVVANQVADRFTKTHAGPSSNAVSRTTSGNSQGAERELTPQPLSYLTPTVREPQQEENQVLTPDPLALDHQQRWFTGWGDMQFDSAQSLKTPSLGLVWTNQIACRIALVKLPVFASRAPLLTINGEDRWNDDQDQHISKWRRWFKVVFAPWAAPSDGRGVEFEVLKSGIRHVSKDKS